MIFAISLLLIFMEFFKQSKVNVTVLKAKSSNYERSQYRASSHNDEYYTIKYSQTCIKRSPLGQRKSDLIRGSIHIKFSVTGQEKGVHLIQVTGVLLKEVTAWADLTVYTWYMY